MCHLPELSFRTCWIHLALHFTDKIFPKLWAALFLLTRLCDCPIVHLTLKVSMTSLLLVCKHLLLESSIWYHENREILSPSHLLLIVSKASLTSVAWFTIDSMWFWDSLFFLVSTAMTFAETFQLGNIGTVFPKLSKLVLSYP